MIWFPNSDILTDLEGPELFANSLQSIKQELAFSALVTKKALLHFIENIL